MSLSNNKEMIRGLMSDDKSAIDLIYKIYHQRIYSFAFSYLKMTEDAMDIVHEVFMKLWEHRAQIEADGNIESLIFTIARNTILSTFRKKASERKYLDHLTALSITEDSGTEELLDYQFMKEQVDELIDQLPPKRRTIFMISRNEGLANKEIAEKLNISEKTVEDHMTKALAFLRSRMKGLGLFAMLYYYLFY
jgi:RNA polymerase sigma-70 factor (ECF subfamily)